MKEELEFPCVEMKAAESFWEKDLVEFEELFGCPIDIKFSLHLMTSIKFVWLKTFTIL